MMYDNIGMAAHKLEDIFYYLREAAVEELPKEKLSACLLMAAILWQRKIPRMHPGILFRFHTQINLYLLFPFKTPVASVFSRMKLAVYDLSHKLAKEIRFEMEGEELLVDRLVAEQLAEPLMHMVRNSADHGDPVEPVSLI